MVNADEMSAVCDDCYNREECKAACNFQCTAVEALEKIQAENERMRAVVGAAKLYVLAYVNGIQDDRKILFGELIDELQKLDGLDK